MTRVTYRSTIALLVLVALAIGGFGLTPHSAQAQAKVVSIAFTQEPDSLNPMYSTQTYSGLARELFLRGPWMFDDQLNLVPVLAKEIPSLSNGGVSADGKTITVRLRDDIVWSDGAPITSDDFLFTAEMYKSEKNAPLSRGIFENDVETVTAPDKTTVVVTFKSPFAPWPSNFFGPILPAHVLRPVFEKDGSLDKAEWNTNPTVGNGPFVLKEYQRGQFLLFAANDKYVLGRPKLDQVLVKIMPDDAAQVAGLKAGDVDLGYFLAPADAIDLRDNFPINIVTVGAGYNEGWFYNLNPEKGHPAIQDVNVRKAISMAINRQEIMTGLLNDLFAASASFWDTTPFMDPELKPPAYDPEGAKKLLDEAGWVVGSDGVREKGGVKLKIRYATNSRQLRKDTQRVIEEQLKPIGVAFEIINYPNQQFLQSYEKEGPIARGQFDVAQWSSSPKFPDPDTSRFRISEIGTEANKFVGSNWSHVNDKELDDLFAKELATVDAEARMKIFHQISKIVAERMYWMPLWQDPDLWAINKRVKDMKPSGGTPFWNVHEWAVE